MKWYEYWKEKRLKWHKALGLGSENYRYHDHLNLAHYANAACDIQFNFPMGFKELEGIHSRTDFDLKSHEKYSGKKKRAPMGSAFPWLTMGGLTCAALLPGPSLWR